MARFIAPHLSSKQLVERITTIIGGLILAFLILSSWLPQPYPLLKRILYGPPSTPSATVVYTPDQKELERVAHQDIASQLIVFNNDLQTPRNRTRVDFEYRNEDPNTTAYLRLEEGSTYNDIALITSPVFNNLDWPLLSDDQWTLYQKDAKYESIDDLIKQLPEPKTLAVDSVAAKAFNLTPAQYTPLENALNNPDITYILSSFHQPYKDGTWKQYDYTIDASNASTLTERDRMFWEISLDPPASKATPFRLGTVHVDYQKSFPK